MNKREISRNEGRIGWKLERDLWNNDDEEGASMMIQPDKLLELFLRNSKNRREWNKINGDSNPIAVVAKSVFKENVQVDEIYNEVSWILIFNIFFHISREIQRFKLQI